MFAERFVWSVVLCAFILGGCHLLNAKTAASILNAAQVACILLSHLTSEDAVMQACAVEESLRPHLKEVLAGKSAAMKSGVIIMTGASWIDAGAKDASADADASVDAEDAAHE